MLTFEIKYTDSTTDIVNMKTAYDEITFRQFTKLCNNVHILDEQERVIMNIAELTGLSVGIIKQFDAIQIRAAKPYLRFIDDVGSLKALQPPQEIKDLDISKEPWATLEQAKMLIKTDIKVGSKHLLNSMAEVVKIYTSIDVWELPFVQAYPMVTEVKNKLELFFANYTRLNDFSPSQEQVNAGIERFERYGFFTTLHALCKGNPLMYDQMLKVPAAQVYQTLVADFEQADYAERLRKEYTKK